MAHITKGDRGLAATGSTVCSSAAGGGSDPPAIGTSAEAGAVTGALGDGEVGGFRSSYLMQFNDGRRACGLSDRRQWIRSG